MSEEEEREQRKRLFEASFVASCKRLQKQGLGLDQAAIVAMKLAEERTNRSKTPIFDSAEDYADFTRVICQRLARGDSYHEVVDHWPFLRTVQIDETVKTAEIAFSDVGLASGPEYQAIREVLDPYAVMQARRMTKLEYVSRALAAITTSIALAILGIWPAVLIGVATAVLVESLVQVGSSRSLRVLFVRLRLPLVLNVAAIVFVLYFGIRWLRIAQPPVYQWLIAAVALWFVAYPLPALVMAFMLGRADRRWTRTRERQLLHEAGASVTSDGRVV